MRSKNIKFNHRDGNLSDAIYRMSMVGAVVRALVFYQLMWLGIDSLRYHMWVELVGFLLCSERFFPVTKNQHLICTGLI